MRKSNTPANIAAIEQLKRKYLLVTRRQCMKKSNTLATIAAMKQLQRDHLPNTIKSVHRYFKMKIDAQFINRENKVVLSDSTLNNFFPLPPHQV